MKKLLTVLLTLSAIHCTTYSQLLKKLGDKIKDKTAQRADQKTDQAIDKGLDKTENGIKNAGSTTATTDTKTTNTPVTGNATAPSDTSKPGGPVNLSIYQNYDFIPGQTVLFEDDFSSDAIGEFGTHWELQKGQAVVNKMGDKTVLLITDGNYGWVTPLMKKKKYLGTEWTIELDHWRNNEAYPLYIFLQDEGLHDKGKIAINNSSASVNYVGADGSEPKTLEGNFPENMHGEKFFNKWHHIAIAYKNKQIKVYVDQVRVVVVPNCNLEPAGFALGSIASQAGPIVFTNVRIAEGAGMNMLGKKFTDTKIITHGINFDVNKAIIKPESMGTLNGIVQIMKDNPDVKFEVGGHTDSDGDDALNLKLSQARADAVRTQLISMGIDASRLTAKGYGKTKPISDNTTPEGKANNRRVEFVKN